MTDKGRTLATSIVALLFLTLLPLPASAQGIVGSISLECGDDPDITVKPGEYQDEIVECTVTNDGAILAENIDITEEWDGVYVNMAVSENSFTLEAGESADFTITFSCDERTDAEIEYEFTITATVTAWGPIPVEGTPLSQVANHSGDVTIKEYGMVTLDVPDTSSRNMEVSDEISITFQVDNDGNSVDTIEIRITNANELEQLGFVLQSGDFLRADDVQSGGVSNQLEFIIRAPSEAKSEIRNLIVIEASSTLDDSKDIVDFDLIVEAEQESGSLGAGLSEVSTDDMALYGAIGGGILLVLFLLIIIGRVSKRSSKNRIATDAPTEPPIEIDDDELEFDLDLELDFDDDEFDSDDLDSMLDDL
ncbi:MAG: hypothetical protein CMB25_01620 [Euryarchaeota archaeon]|nr:hypothetical protein [Euryarchaeota archaeon]|tara:strand:+ start:27399 stop:28490 length:1092 start_codon:yes stop_codon:yes gene_type:complete